MFSGSRSSGRSVRNVGLWGLIVRAFRQLLVRSGLLRITGNLAVLTGSKPSQARLSNGLRRRSAPALDVVRFSTGCCHRQKDSIPSLESLQDSGRFVLSVILGIGAMDSRWRVLGVCWTKYRQHRQVSCCLPSRSLEKDTKVPR
jgi:hypothetical protein